MSAANDYDTIFLCPYCGDIMQEEYPFCCSEANHGERHAVSENARGEQMFVNLRTRELQDEFNDDSRVER